MALVRCLDCDEVAEVGCMPTTSCALLVVVPIGAAIPCAVLATRAAWDAWGWWSLLVPLPVFWAAAVAGFYLAIGLPYTLEYLLARRKACQKCGGRRWSFPFTAGFGA